HELLLFDQASGRVDADEAAVLDHSVVLELDERLEAAERICRILAQAQVEASLVVLEGLSREQDAAHRLVERDVEVERQRGRHGKRVQPSQPGSANAADGVSSVRG